MHGHAKKRKAWEIARKIQENSSEVKILKANLLLTEGRIDDAEQLLDTIEDKEELANIVEVAYMYIDMGYPEKALEWLSRGLEQYAEEEAFIAATGDCYHAQGLNEKAAYFYNKLIDKNPIQLLIGSGWHAAILPNRCLTRLSKPAIMLS